MSAAGPSLGDALALYLHWPYCARICPYCDFNVYRPKGNSDALVAAMLAEMDYWRGETGGRKLASVHFGGGTPSLLETRQLAALIGRAEALWGFAEGAEIGLEANPKDAGRFADYAAAGLNRLSLGVQSFDDAALRALGRDHDGAMARASIDAAQTAFPRVSLDLIYARAGQDAQAWEAELREALGTGVGHVSPYQLTIESGTAFGKRAERGEELAAPPDFAADLYELTHAVCEEAGLPAYEISNHARSPADQSRHNRIYWEGGDWIGVGPGAHGRLGRASAGGRLATAARRRPADYVAAVTAAPPTAAECERLDAADETVERTLMGLRLADGLDLAHLLACTGRSVDAGGFERMREAGYVEAVDGRVRLTASGRLLADGVSAALVPEA